jgi:hypothetical protein
VFAGSLCCAFHLCFLLFPVALFYEFPGVNQVEGLPPVPHSDEVSQEKVRRSLENSDSLESASI